MPKWSIANKSLLSESTILLLAQILSVVGSLLLVRVLTSYLSPSEYGAFGLALSVASVFNSVFLPGILAATSRYYSIAHEAGELDEYLGCIKELIRYIFGFLSAILLVSVAILYISGYKKWIYLDLAIWIFSISNGVAVIYAGIQNSARNRIQFSALYGLDSWFRIAFCLIIFHLISINATNTGIGYAISSLLLLSIQYVLFNNLFQIKNKTIVGTKIWFTKLAQYGYPFIITSFFFWAQINSGRWILEIFSTRESIGYFVVLTQLGFSSIQIIVTLLLNIINPILIFKGEDSRTSVQLSNVKRVIFYISIIGGIVITFIFLVSFVFNEWIFSIVAGIRYQSISYLLPWIILAGGFYGVSQVISSIPIYLEKSSHLLSPIIYSSVLGTIATLVLAPYFGLNGVIVALCIFSSTHIMINLLRVININK